MPLRKAQHPRAATAAVAVSGAFPYPYPLQVTTNPLPLAPVQRESLNEIIHRWISCLFSSIVHV